MRNHPSLIAAGVVGVCLAILLSGAAAPERIPTDRSLLIHGGPVAKAAVDTVTLMGPHGLYPYRGDFETASALPGGDGLLTDGWTSRDETAPEVHWHVSAYNNPGSGNGAACRAPDLESCDAGDPAGGYGNSWYDILEFRRAVPGDATVRVQGKLRYDVEPGYDYVYLQRRTAADPDFERVIGGQGLSWDGVGNVVFDYTFTYAASERVDGSDIAVALVVDSDGAWSDADCLWTTDGAAFVDDLVVTVTAGGATVSVEDFEDGVIGPDWHLVPLQGVGDFARVWTGLCEDDPCRGNGSNQVAFINTYPELMVVPPPPAGCGRVNGTGGFLGGGYDLDNFVRSPVIALPGGDVDGVTVSFDVYTDNQITDYDPIYWTWAIRSSAGPITEGTSWTSRNFVYYGGPQFRRLTLQVGDLLVPDASSMQVALGALQLSWGDWERTADTSAPYFDNVRVQAYPSAGPRIVITEQRLANDGFPASGTLDLANLANNSVRFDMAANIAARTHLRNDPGDSIFIDATPRSGATLDPPLMHWTLARRNPLFDAYRTLPPSPVTGRVTRTAAGAVVANRWNFDLPDTGFLFPGDVLHYYFSATDHRAGDTRTSIAPVDLAGYGDEHSPVWPPAFTVRCLPSLADVAGTQPALLLWNDQGSGGAEDEWRDALWRLGWVPGADIDVFTTRAPGAGVGNGLGGRATVAQVAGYTDLLYTAGTLSSPTLSNGDFNADPGNDLALLNGWLALGDRDMLLCGEDLANSLYSSGVTARAFLETTMGLQLADGDVRDNIGGQVSPVVSKAPGNPVFLTANRWLLYGGCPTPNDFDAVLPQAGTVTLANFTDPGGTATPYPHPAATLRTGGTNRIISIPYDLSFVMDWDKQPSPAPMRMVVLDNLLSYFAVPGGGGSPTAVPAAAQSVAVRAQPNPFNPSVELRYTLARPGHLAMKVYDTRGALVRTLVDGPVAVTSGVVVWDGADDRGGQAASGLYFVETRADGQVDVRKVTMVK
jgi:hypothetical protein